MRYEIFVVRLLPRFPREAQPSPMPNPWNKKNPWLSLWLSGANAVLGSARATWLREAQRQRASVMRETQRQITDFWLGSGAPRRKRRRRGAV